MEKYCRGGQATDDDIILRMRFACWITKATDTHSAYVIHTAFPRLQWLRERVSVLRYRYVICYVILRVNVEKLSSRAIFYILRYFFLPVLSIL